MQWFSAGTRGKVLWVAGVVLLMGCGSTRTSSPRPTGFLGDLSGLQRVGGDADQVRVYVVEPGVLGRYDRFILDPVMIYLHQDSEGRGVNPEELRELAASLRDKVSRQLADGGYSVVEEPGPGVLRIRTALTDVDPSSTALNVAAKVAGAVAGPGAFLVPTVDLGRASIEVEMRDAASGERVVAFMDSRQGRRMGGTLAAAREWGHVEAAFSSWAEEFRRRLDELHGR